MKDGSVDIGVYGAGGKNTGEGVHFSSTSDGGEARLLQNGVEVRPITLKEAREAAERMGFTEEQMGDFMKG